MSVTIRTPGVLIRVLAICAVMILLVRLTTLSPPRPALTIAATAIGAAWLSAAAVHVFRTGRKWFACSLGTGAVGWVLEGLANLSGFSYVSRPWYLWLLQLFLAVSGLFLIRKERKVRPDRWEASKERLARSSLLDIVTGRHLA